MTTADLYFMDDFGNSVTTASVAEIFATLDSTVRDKFLEKRCDWYTQGSWWDYVYDQFTDKMTEVGIELDHKSVQLINGKTRYDPAIYFSGFWSQGDGACFEGRIKNWPKVLAALAAQNKDLQCFVDIYDSSVDMSFSCYHSDRYYHSQSVSYVNEFDVGNMWDEDSLRYLAYQALLNECNSYLDDLWKALKDMFRSHMDQLYKDLEEEHGHLTSDETLIESLEMDDIEELLCELE